MNTTINTTTATPAGITGISVGNHYDSRLPGKVYAMWTTGDDIKISADKEYYYQRRNYDHDEVVVIEPTELVGAREVSWADLPVSVRKAHYQVVCPTGTEEEENLFVYGEEEARRMSEELSWADSHRILDNRTLSLRIANYIGRWFEEVRFIRAYGTFQVFILDDKELITIDTSSDTFSVEDYAKVLARQKAYGRHVARLAKAAGVPWAIARFVAHLENDDEAVAILEQLKAARGTAGEFSFELTCGIRRRTAAIEAILGEDLWAKLKCSGQNQTRALADYLS